MHYIFRAYSCTRVDALFMKFALWTAGDSANMFQAVIAKGHLTSQVHMNSQSQSEY